MAVLQTQHRRWTYEEYYRLEDDLRREIIQGNLLMSPAPDTWHQTWLGGLFFIFQNHIKRRHLGRVFVSPLDVILDSENVVQPDLVFVSKDHLELIQPRGIFGTPDLVVELVSAGSLRLDRHEKKDLYCRFGIKEYWIGDPANRSLEIFTLERGDYHLHSQACQAGTVTSPLLPGLEINLSQFEPLQNDSCS